MDLVLLPWETSHCQQLWKWANDPLTREMAFSSDPIPWEEHIAWFASKRENIQCYPYIAYCQDHPVGQIRFDITIESEQSYASIDYSVSPLWRGKGVGSLLLLKGTSVFFSEAPPHCGHVIGMVKNENTSSLKCFLKAGFSRVSTKVQEKAVTTFMKTR